MPPLKTELKKVYSTQSGCVYQCNKDYCFWIDFAGQLTPFKVPCFFALKKLVENINLHEMAVNPGKSFDFEIINPCGSERCYVLSLAQIVEFKELLSGARVMLELNSILCERLKTISSKIPF
jgi:hypothetical protein